LFSIIGIWILEFICNLGFEFCLPVRCTQTGNLIFRAKKAKNCPPARPATLDIFDVKGRSA